MTSHRKPPHGTGREAIVRATVAVIADAGLRGLTYRRVAERAGVNNSLIAHHFGSRDALVAAALEWAVDASITTTHLGEFISSHDEFRRALERSVVGDAELQAFQFEMILEARRRPELVPLVRALYERYEGEVAAAIGALGGDGVTPGVRRAIFGALDGLSLQRLSGTIDADEFDEALRGVLALAVRVAPSATHRPPRDTRLRRPPGSAAAAAS